VGGGKGSERARGEEHPGAALLRCLGLGPPRSVSFHGLMSRTPGLNGLGFSANKTHHSHLARTTASTADPHRCRVWNPAPRSSVASASPHLTRKTMKLNWHTSPLPPLLPPRIMRTGRRTMKSRKLYLASWRSRSAQASSATCSPARPEASRCVRPHDRIKHQLLLLFFCTILSLLMLRFVLILFRRGLIP
jgi:hypothetical protein